jgi:hypothetical protein
LLTPRHAGRQEQAARQLWTVTRGQPPSSGESTSGTAEEAGGVESSRELQLAKEQLNARLEAARTISGSLDRDAALTGVVRDAAAAGETAVVKSALQRIGGGIARDDAAREAALLLAKRGLRKEAVEIAKGISGSLMRDATLSELAR